MKSKLYIDLRGENRETEYSHIKKFLLNAGWKIESEAIYKFTIDATFVKP